MGRAKQAAAVILAGGLWAALGGGIGAGLADSAQSRAAQALAEVQRNIQLSEARQAELKAQAEAIGHDEQKLSAALAEAGRRERELTLSLNAAAARMADLQQRQQVQQQQLEQRRAELAEILAGLEKLGFNPPPAVLAPAKDAAQSLHAAILMSALLPQMREKLAAARAAMAELEALRRQISAEQQNLNHKQTELKEEQLRLSLLLEEKSKLQDKNSRDLAAEEENRRNLAAKANSLQELLEEVGKQMQSSAGGQIQPEVKFSGLRGKLPLPVAGKRLVRFGQMADGKPVQGELYAVAAGAEALAPMESIVRYAGQFRSYGSVLILDAGEDYYMVLAGLSRLYAAPGQMLLQGEPVGVMESALPAGQDRYIMDKAAPRLYIELRKDGKLLDPAGWWRKAGRGRG